MLNIINILIFITIILLLPSTSYGDNQCIDVFENGYKGQYIKFYIDDNKGESKPIYHITKYIYDTRNTIRARHYIASLSDRDDGGFMKYDVSNSTKHDLRIENVLDYKDDHPITLDKLLFENKYIEISIDTLNNSSATTINESMKCINLINFIVSNYVKDDVSIYSNGNLKKIYASYYNKFFIENNKKSSALSIKQLNKMSSDLYKMVNTFYENDTSQVFQINWIDNAWRDKDGSEIILYIIQTEGRYIYSYGVNSESLSCLKYTHYTSQQVNSCINSIAESLTKFEKEKIPKLEVHPWHTMKKNNKKGIYFGRLFKNSKKGCRELIEANDPGKKIHHNGEIVVKLTNKEKQEWASRIYANNDVSSLEFLGSTTQDVISNLASVMEELIQPDDEVQMSHGTCISNLMNSTRRVSTPYYISMLLFIIVPMSFIFLIKIYFKKKANYV